MADLLGADASLATPRNPSRIINHTLLWLLMRTFSTNNSWHKFLLSIPRWFFGLCECSFGLDEAFGVIVYCLKTLLIWPSYWFKRIIFDFALFSWIFGVYKVTKFLAFLWIFLKDTRLISICWW
jgi:hypothetical protein